MFSSSEARARALKACERPLVGDEKRLLDTILVEIECASSDGAMYCRSYIDKKGFEFVNIRIVESKLVSLGYVANIESTYDGFGWSYWVTWK